jgi:hypothetical protein
MTFGIAIPSYINHIKYIPNLLDEISKSTILPNQVSISISSYDDELQIGNYPFEVIITKHRDAKNASQNRNIAGSKLSTDIISFFDSDDLPHRKRNEYILKSFELGACSVVHDYHISPEEIKEYSNDIGDIDLKPDYVDTFISDTHFPMNSKNHLSYANGHVSVLSEIFNKVKYNETSTYSEDAEFNSQIVKLGYKISYIGNKLSYYKH